MGTDHKNVLARAIVKILRPLVRLLIRNEVTHAELTELVRQTYVDVAYESYSIPGQEMTFSRVAVLTGLSRKEVVRLKSILEKVQEDLEGPTYTLPLWFYEILLYEIAPDWRFEDSNHLTEMYFDIERLVKKYRNAERYGVSTQGLIDNRDK